MIDGSGYSLVLVLAFWVGFGENAGMKNESGCDTLFEVNDDDIDELVVRVPAGRSKVFRPYDPSQSFLMPPSLDDWLPQDHTARFVAETVDELLDLSVIYDSYVEACGAPPYDPSMMLKLLLYAYSTGVTSSREMERRCHLDVAFRWLSANSVPDYRSISRFRRRHLVAVDALFLQVLVLCSEAGLVKLGRVALDGTKLRASASRHKAMSYSHLGPKIEQLEAEVASILADAEATDLAEDEAFGVDKRGDEVPPELARRETRLVKMRAAKEAIEAEARDKAAQKAEDKIVKDTAKKAAKKAADRAADRAASDAVDEPDDEATDNTDHDNTSVEDEIAQAVAAAVPEGRAQRNFTDPGARMMKTNDGFHYAYNAQAVVDEYSQVVVAAHLTNNASDMGELIPMIDTATHNLTNAGIGGAPKLVLADAGYCSQDNLEHIRDTKVNALIATGRLKANENVSDTPRGRIPKDATERERMARKLRTKAGRVDYARRKAIVEPVFGQMKTRQQAGHLRLRGITGAQGEWTLHAMCHNLRKLANAANRIPLPAS